jgi:biopolymer transport protein ExbD
MATIATGGGQGGKKALDHEVPLVPFIDLLLCCVMFLLVTAVWNRLAAVQTNLRAPGDETAMIAPPPTQPLTVHVGEGAFLVASDVGDRTEIPWVAGEPDVEALVEHLALRRDAFEGRVVVVADDGIHYEDVILTMDAAARAGYADVAMGD